MEGSKMKSNWSKKLSVLVVMTTSIPLVSLQATEDVEKKKKFTPQMLAEIGKMSWKVLSDEEKKEDYTSLLFGLFHTGFPYLTEGERAVVREAFREAENKAQERGSMWFSKEAEKAEADQEAEDKKAFESVLSPYVTERQRKTAWKEFSEKRWGNPRRTRWWRSRASVDLEKVKSLFHGGECVGENPLSEKEKMELRDLIGVFLHDSDLYLTPEERGKVWAVMQVAVDEGLARWRQANLEGESN